MRVVSPRAIDGRGNGRGLLSDLARLMLVGIVLLAGLAASIPRAAAPAAGGPLPAHALPARYASTAQPATRTPVVGARATGGGHRAHNSGATSPASRRPRPAPAPALTAPRLGTSSNSYAWIVQGLPAQVSRAVTRVEVSGCWTSAQIARLAAKPAAKGVTAALTVTRDRHGVVAVTARRGTVPLPLSIVATYRGRLRAASGAARLVVHTTLKRPARLASLTYGVAGPACPSPKRPAPTSTPTTGIAGSLPPTATSVAGAASPTASGGTGSTPPTNTSAPTTAPLSTAPAAPTSTPVPPPATATSTPVPPPATVTNTPTSTPPATVTNSPTATVTSTPPATVTNSPTATITATPSPAPTATLIAGHGIKTVFLIVMENHTWASIHGSPDAPYINNTLLPLGAHAEQYYNPRANHPSEPNYLWLEAGTNFGIHDDSPPATNHQSTTTHLVTLLNRAGVSWTSYQEDITGQTCPLTNSANGRYDPKHNPQVYFDDVTGTNDPTSSYCIAHERPYTDLATNLANNTVARYNFITPNLCDDGHDSCAPLNNPVKQTDTWLSQEVPTILNSQAYKDGGALFITWDEGENGSDGPIGMIVESPFAKVNYSNSTSYTHSSTLRTMEEIFGVSPLLGDAANQTDLSALFTAFP